jgi:hypothetical protein
LSALGPPNYRGPLGDITDPATVASVANLEALRQQYKTKGKNDEQAR